MNDVTTNEVIDFLKEHMMMKEEVETIMEEKLQATESRILSAVDRFAKLHETLDQELVMMRSQYNRLEERLEIVEQKLGIPA
jgi:predicted Zn-ribbon and HTH transcriptional regulator